MSRGLSIGILIRIGDGAPRMSREDDATERAHGGTVRRDGDIATLGDGSRWWLNGTAWARHEADALAARNLNRGRGVQIARTHT